MWATSRSHQWTRVQCMLWNRTLVRTITQLLLGFCTTLTSLQILINVHSWSRWRTLAIDLPSQPWRHNKYFKIQSADTPVLYLQVYPLPVHRCHICLFRHSGQFRTVASFTTDTGVWREPPSGDLVNSYNWIGERNQSASSLCKTLKPSALDYSTRVVCRIEIILHLGQAPDDVCCQPGVLGVLEQYARRAHTRC